MVPLSDYTVVCFYTYSIAVTLFVLDFQRTVGVDASQKVVTPKNADRPASTRRYMLKVLITNVLVVKNAACVT